MSVTRYHTMPVEMHIAGDAVEISAEIEYTLSGGCSAHMGSLSYAGHPAEAPELQIEKVELVIIDKTSSPHETVRQEAPRWLVNFIANSDAVYQELGEAADWGENGGPDPDCERDLRLEDEGQRI